MSEHGHRSVCFFRLIYRCCWSTHLPQASCFLVPLRLENNLLCVNRRCQLTGCKSVIYIKPLFYREMTRMWPVSRNQNKLPVKNASFLFISKDSCASGCCMFIATCLWSFRSTTAFIGEPDLVILIATPTDSSNHSGTIVSLGVGMLHMTNCSHFGGFLFTLSFVNTLLTCCWYKYVMYLNALWTVADLFHMSFATSIFSF